MQCGTCANFKNLGCVLCSENKIVNVHYLYGFVCLEHGTVRALIDSVVGAK